MRPIGHMRHALGKHMLFKKLPAILTCFIFLIGLAPVVFAQDIGNGTAVGISIAEKNIKTGEIIASTSKGYKRSTAPYDPYLFGVINLEPALYLADDARPNDTPVITSGKVGVLVSTINGPIKKDDFITSSSIPGIGQKATENGTVLGTAEEGYAEKDPKRYGLVQVALNPHFAQVSSNVTHNIFRAAQLGATAALQTPLGALRYLVAGVIVLLSFFFGFRFFGRVSGSGVEAMGRNPLASKSIMLSVMINTLITIFIMLFGVAISYLILVL